MGNLLEIKPNLSVQINCLICHSEKVEIKEIVWQGIHILADCSCKNCNMQFYQTLPIGHGLWFPVSFDKEGNCSSFNEEAGGWLAKPLLESFFKHPREEAKIEKKVFLERENAIILNCLDSCYGHVFTKMWNAQFLLDAYPGMAVIILLPKNLEWLVPKGIAEIWTVEIPLGQFKKYISNLDPFIKREQNRFKSIYLSQSYIHLDTAKIDIEAFVNLKRFNLKYFGISPPQITFVLREDRFWHGNQLEFLFFKIGVKLKINTWFRSYFRWRQNKFVNKIAGTISKQLNEVKFFATGIGKGGGLSSFINDERRERVSAVTEADWCSIYSKSHIVIGVHGSNMLIPTSLSAGFIELLPRYKIPHITEDLFLQYSSRYSLFLGRHLDHYAPAGLVSAHALSMIKDFPFLYRNTEQRV